MQQPPDFPPPSPGFDDQLTTRSGMAVVALIFGIIGLLPICFPAIVGLVAGIVALNQISKSRGQLTGSGMATLGIILSGAGMVIFVVTLLLAMMLPAFAQAQRHANFTRNATQQRSVITALVSYSETNKGRYPGISRSGDNTDGDPFTDVTYDDGTAAEGCDVELRFYLLLASNYFTGELAISPFDQKTIWQPGAITTDNYSYALLHLGEDDGYLAKRAVEWKNTINSQAALLSDRSATGDVQKSMVQSVAGNMPGDWEGHVGWGDNHVETLISPVIQSKYGATSIKNFSYTEFFDTGDYLFDAGEVDDRGNPVGDRQTGNGAFMVYEGTGL